MVVFPTHRLLHSLPNFSADTLFEQLAPFFTLSDQVPDQAGLQALAEAGKNAYLVVTEEKTKLAKLREGAPLAKVKELSRNPEVRSLDVAVLHSVILEHILGISIEAQAKQTNLRYSKKNEEALSAPAKMADVQAAFLMNSTEINEVIAVSDVGEVMPQKSTYFFPKIPSGVVLYPLD